MGLLGYLGLGLNWIDRGNVVGFWDGLEIVGLGT
jgi:hypothetical protein